MILSLSFSEAVFSSERTLLDSELSQWDIYLSYAHSPNYKGDIPKDQHGDEIQPICLNPEDARRVFTMIGADESVLKVSGEYYGALTTKQEYENYHLSLEVKWGEKIWPAREGKLKDTGIFVSRY